MNVLVAVSDTRTRLQIEEVLLSRKHQFNSYSTAQEAWSDLQHNSYSLTIVDSSFQIQGDSIVVCLRRFERSEFMLVLGITNTTDCGELRKMIDSGADDYLVWPEERSQLYLRLQIAELWVRQYEKWRDEFAILADDLPSKEHAIIVAQRLQDQFATAFQIQGRDLISSASIGIAIGTGEYDFPQQLLQAADRAMYRAKQLGGNCHQLAEFFVSNE